MSGLSHNISSIISLMAVAVTVVSLLEASLAADAPAPTPVATAGGAISPSLAFSFLVSFAAFLFGSALVKI